MSQLILYRTVLGPPGRAVLMLCHTLGLRVEIKEVGVIGGETQTPDFKKLNPMGMLPVLQDGDFILSESHAIITYLVGAYGGDKQDSLYPSKLHTRMLVDQCMYFDASMFFTAVRAIVFRAFFYGKLGPSERNLQDLEYSYGVVEAYLRQRKYVAADHLTLADYSVGAVATAARGMLQTDPNLNRFPRCADWLKRLEEIPAFKKVNAPGVAYANKFLQKAWENNRNK